MPVITYEVLSLPVIDTGGSEQVIRCLRWAGIKAGDTLKEFAEGGAWPGKNVLITGTWGGATLHPVVRNILDETPAQLKDAGGTLISFVADGQLRLDKNYAYLGWVLTGGDATTDLTITVLLDLAAPGDLAAISAAIAALAAQGVVAHAAVAAATTAQELAVNGNRLTHQVTIEVVLTATGAARVPAAGTLQIVAKPYGAEEYEDLSEAVDLTTAPTTVVINGSYESLKFTPALLDGDCSFQVKYSGITAVVPGIYWA